MNLKNSLIPPQVNPSKNKQLQEKLRQSVLQNRSLYNVNTQHDIGVVSHASHLSNNRQKKEDPLDKKSQQIHEEPEEEYDQEQYGLQEYEYDDESSQYEDEQQEEYDQGEYEESEDSDDYSEQIRDEVPDNLQPTYPVTIQNANGRQLSVKAPSKAASDKLSGIPNQQLLDDQFDKQKLDRMYKFPASYKEAMVHNMASKFGFSTAKIKRDENQEKQLQDILASFLKNQGKVQNPTQKALEEKELQKKLKKYQKVPICPCCQNLIANVQIPLCYPTQPSKPKSGEAKFLLQTGVSMYFVFIKAVIVYLVLRFLIFDIANIIFSFSGHYCSSQLRKDECTYTTISGYNLNSLQDTRSLQIMDILSLLLTILSIIYFIIYRRKQAQLIGWLDRNNKSQKDFSLLIEDIPLFIHEKNMKKDDVNYNYEYILKTKIQEKVRDWLKTIFDVKSQSDLEEQIQYHFYKFVFQRKVADQIEAAEERKKNPKPINLKKKQKPEPQNPQEWREQVKNLILKKMRIVPSISLCYDLTELQTMSKIRNQLIQAYIKQNQGQILDENSQQFQVNDQLEHIPNQIDLLNKQYTELCNKLAIDQTASFSLSHFSGKAIIAFQYKHYRDYFLRQYGQNPDFLQMNGKALRISLTNKPEDIYWYNMKVSDSDRSRFIFYSYAILFMLLVLSFASLIGLQYWQTHTELPVNTTAVIDKIKSSLFSVAMAILTNVINFILSYSIELLADMEKHKTKSDRLTSLIIKIIVTQTINTAFIYYIIWVMAPTNPLGKAGLVKNILDLVIVSGFISVVLQIFPPSYLAKKFINDYKYKDKDYINMFQVQLNEILQQPEFNFAVMYAFYIVFTFVVSFYGFVAPTAIPVLIVIFAIQFWVDKYNLFKRFSCPVDFGAELIKKIFIMFETSIFIFVIGHYIWDLKMNKDKKPEYRVISSINIVLAILFVTFELAAPDRLKKKIFPFQQEECDPFSYTSYQRQDTFKKTFFRENPATSCLKQTKLNVGKRKKNKKLQQEVVYQAPDPEFIPPHERIFHKFLTLEQKRKILQRYSAFDQQYYQNLDNQDWDEVEAEQRCRELQKKKRQNQKNKQNASVKSKQPSQKKI